MNLLKQNSKMEKASIYTEKWSIPARTYCPNKGACAGPCYAGKGFFRIPNVRQTHEKNAELTKQDDFVSLMTAEIKYKRLPAVRIHDSGDFYSVEYMVKWLRIASRCPNTRFYAYTKMVRNAKDLTSLGFKPNNFTFIFSYGGTEDDQIHPEFDRHAHIFPDVKSLKAAGYIDASKDDSMAWDQPNNKIGLVFNGPDSKLWVTHG